MRCLSFIFILAIQDGGTSCRLAIMNVTIFWPNPNSNISFLPIFSLSVCVFSDFFLFEMQTRRRAKTTTKKMSNISYWNFARHIAFMSLFALAISIIFPFSRRRVLLRRLPLLLMLPMLFRHTDSLPFSGLLCCISLFQSAKNSGKVNKIPKNWRQWIHLLCHLISPNNRST